jgi:hypothetical protein
MRDREVSLLSWLFSDNIFEVPVAKLLFMGRNDCLRTVRA